MKRIMTLFIISLVVMFLFGCTKSDKIYDEMMKQGLEHIKKEKYEIASGFFENALNEKQDDQKAATLFQQTQKMAEAVNHFDEGELGAASESIHQAAKIKDGSDILVKKAEQLRDQITDMKAEKNKYAERYEEAKEKFKDEQYDESIKILESILQKDLSHPFFADIKNEAETSLREVTAAKAQALKEVEKIARAEAEAKAKAQAEKAEQEKMEAELEAKSVGTAEGYWLTADRTAACHLTNHYLACAVKESDNLFKDQIVEVNRLNDVDIELTFADGHKTNIALLEKNVMQTEGEQMYRVSKEEANSIYGGYYILP